MEIQVNGQWREFPDGTTVEGVLEALGTAAQGVAVAVDGVVVRRGDWPEAVVRKGASVDILTAVQGG
ncbi:sulfur carrier protein ThiS [Amycolatopsis sp. BJA-103]|uniref:sulfur carrier protein ThiS n=1 Tax=Amycolatopsis sp. BJA-103 TaxID=1911175 RepID=UPI000C7825FE|nr:sulfur carrier protein ThiS [Amycolatopsis sp. BJA-103]AUI62025.1 thiamine biosynthesis protein ThiS [Amycolatopsis sp. BJA-103]PNE20675.1 thiamine biosynthesis protein ThiS [Amycolatopsis sp. BJA-103]